MLITGLAPLRDARRDTPLPVARGFVTWGTDSGHDNKKLPHPRAFALNDEALVNMAYAAYKKTHDAGVRIVRAFYDRSPAKTYFYGGSEGGREALMMAQRFPTDFEGIVSVVPVANYAGGNLVRAKLGQLQRDGGWIRPAKVKLILNAVNAACDRLDGLEDGVVSAYEKCLSAFDVGTLRCPDGADTGDSCLSDKQIEADRLVHRPYRYPLAMKNGVTAFPGWTYGSEVQPGGMVDTITGKEPPQSPIANEKVQSVAWVNADGFVRYFFARDPKLDPFQFSAEKFAGRIKEISEMFDTTDPDLSGIPGAWRQADPERQRRRLSTQRAAGNRLLQIGRRQNGPGSRRSVRSLLCDARREPSRQRRHEGWQGGAGQSRSAGRVGCLGRFG